ncbi:MAG: beta-L-arabinofuranosidase domain-containing protein [Bacteroidota bacterium]
MKILLRAILVFTIALYFQAGTAQSYVPEWKNSKMLVAPKADIQAYSFNLSQVRLLPGSFLDAAKTDAAVLLRLEPDRLLCDFRVHAGLIAKAKRYDGWESSGLAGHSLGHYLSACAMQYAATGNKEFLNRVNYMVNELDECQKARKTGYLGAIPKEDSVWAEVEKGNITSRGFDLNGAWSPWYTVHKIMAGLLDAWLYCDNANALEINKKFSDWTGHIIRNLDDVKLQKMLFCEYGGMSETLVNTYALTGEKKYLDLSYKFYDKRILDSLAQNIDVLPGKHSNTQIPKAIAGIRRYQLNLDEKDARIANFFWKTVVYDHSYVTGGNSNYEYFGAARKLNDKLTDNTTETCNTYNMLKLTRHLFALNPSAELMNYYEKGLYNHILASQNHENGEVCYFVPLRMGGRKEYSTESFTCCVGSGMENHVKYGESIYYHGKDGSLFVNLFIPSVLNWKAKGITFKQETTIPASNKVLFTINTAKKTSMPLRIRKPNWAGENIVVLINGKTQKMVTGKDGYLVINRSWSNNDKIELTVTSSLYTESMPDNEDRKALFYGPVLLAGILGDKEPEPIKGIPVLVTGNNDPKQWIQKTRNNDLVFNTVNVAKPGDIKLIPFNKTKNEFYSVYWDVFTPEKWTTQQKIYEAERVKQQELEARTVDIIRPGEMQPERDHNFEGDKTHTEQEHGKSWRLAEPGGYFSFTMKVDSSAKNALLCTYWGMDNRGRIFDILIDGETIATEDLNKFKGSQFYDISYPIATKLTANKQSVTVKFVPKTGNSAGPLYGCRMIRE